MLQINNIDRGVCTGLIISAVDKDAMKELLGGDLPADFVGVQNNTTCNPAFLHAAEELSLSPQPVEKSLRVKEEGRRADYKLYYVKNGYAGEFVTGRPAGFCGEIKSGLFVVSRGFIL